MKPFAPGVLVRIQTHTQVWCNMFGGRGCGRRAGVINWGDLGLVICHNVELDECLIVVNGTFGWVRSAHLGDT
jgi:hypothetical protein